MQPYNGFEILYNNFVFFKDEQTLSPFYFQF